MLASVEWVFGTSKRIISIAKNGGTLNFGGIDGKLVIADSMMKIDPPRGKRLWIQFIKSMKILIGEVRLVTKLRQQSRKRMRKEKIVLARMPQVPRVDKFQHKYNISDHCFWLIMNNSDIQFEIDE